MGQSLRDKRRGKPIKQRLVERRERQLTLFD